MKQIMMRISGRRCLAIAGLLAALLAPLMPVMAAQADDLQPRCAVVNYGPIPCPIGVGTGTDKCYVQDTGLKDPKAASAWNVKPCDDKAFEPQAAIDCSKNEKYCDPAHACTSAGNCDLVVKYVNPLIKAASALVGIAVTIAIIWGGIQYATSADDPQKVSQAKRRILTAVLTLVGYFVFYQFLNWIVPGGIR